MFHYIYKTTNLITGTYYIGKHKSKILNNCYLGSGTIIRSSVKKYGSENFKKEILFIFDNPEDAYQKEKEIVNEELLKDPNCMNLCIGGNGPLEHSERTKKKLKNRIPWNKGKTGIYSEKLLLQWSKSHKKHVPWNKGKTGIYSEETLKKLADAAKKTKNSLGKRWSSESKRKMSEIKKGQIPWNKGLYGFGSPMYGKKHSEETKQKMREAALCRWKKRK